MFMFPLRFFLPHGVILSFIYLFRVPAAIQGTMSWLA